MCEEKLLDPREEAALDKQFADAVTADGKRLCEENEALKNDPSAAVPADIDARAHQLIEDTLGDKE